MPDEVSSGGSRMLPSAEDVSGTVDGSDTPVALGTVRPRRQSRARLGTNSTRHLLRPLLSRLSTAFSLSNTLEAALQRSRELLAERDDICCPPLANAVISAYRSLGDDGKA